MSANVVNCRQMMAVVGKCWLLSANVGVLPGGDLINLLTRESACIFWLAFVQIFDTCSSKDNLLSMVIPSNFCENEFFISKSSIKIDNSSFLSLTNVFSVSILFKFLLFAYGTVRSLKTLSPLSRTVY